MSITRVFNLVINISNDLKSSVNLIYYFLLFSIGYNQVILC